MCQASSLADFLFLLSAYVALDQEIWEPDTAPLFLAVDNGHADIVRELLAAGARCTSDVLLVAAENGDAELVKMLLEAGEPGLTC